ncbi:MAG: hypothetical protein ACJA0K_001020 [Maricaulis maris]|jgi:hypothetical protein
MRIALPLRASQTHSTGKSGGATPRPWQHATFECGRKGFRAVGENNGKFLPGINQTSSSMR